MYSFTCNFKRGFKKTFSVKCKYKEDGKITFYISDKYSGYYRIRGGALIDKAFEEVADKLVSATLRKLVRSASKDQVISEFLSSVGFAELVVLQSRD